MSIFWEGERKMATSHKIFGREYETKIAELALFQIVICDASPP
jgi:DeoR/GlpR family transcriptional regulator of sugar metabolism